VRIKNKPDNRRCKIRHLESASAAVFTIVEQVYQARGLDPEITSIDDEPHGTSSRHWYGGAWDVGVRGINLETRKVIEIELRRRLGTDFDVVLEGDHIHIEWEPRA